jgi:sulfatase modifying factor 1
MRPVACAFLVTASVLAACVRSSAPVAPTSAQKDPPVATPVGATSAEPSGSMVPIPEGDLLMGDDQLASSRPEHRVHVAPFAMDVMETTVAEYDACVHARACVAAPTTTPCNGNRRDRQKHPANCVDWSEAAAYCAWAHKRLPTEEEWEYAAIHDERRAYPWGDATPTTQLCWNRSDHTCPVGSYPADRSPFGVYDMGGNVAEWTASGWSQDYTLARDDSVRLSRGGSWLSFNINMVRAADRSRRDPRSRGADLGFRCAR